MLGNRRVDTKPEVLLRSMLHRAGLRFRKDWLIPLSPRGVRADVVFPRQRVAVFMDGCYWHRCPEHGTMPQTNHDYWRAKFQMNIARDLRVNVSLADEGWQVIRIWEHEVLDDDLAEHAVSRVVSAVRGVNNPEGLSESESAIEGAIMPDPEASFESGSSMADVTMPKRVSRSEGSSDAVGRFVVDRRVEMMPLVCNEEVVGYAA